MDTLKFRVLASCDEGDKMIHFENPEQLDNGLFFESEMHIDEYLSGMMLSTGKCDKKGVEIYKGDIVESKSHEPSKYIVDFIEGRFCMVNSQVSYPTDINHFYPSVGTDLVVIGNIHENKELALTI
jgi:uncharacterized phage protein (TIGR01671 family)